MVTQADDTVVILYVGYDKPKGAELTHQYSVNVIQFARLSQAVPEDTLDNALPLFPPLVKRCRCAAALQW